MINLQSHVPFLLQSKRFYRLGVEGPSLFKADFPAIHALAKTDNVILVGKSIATLRHPEDKRRIQGTRHLAKILGPVRKARRLIVEAPRGLDQTTAPVPKTVSVFIVPKPATIDLVGQLLGVVGERLGSFERWEPLWEHLSKALSHVIQIFFQKP